MGKRPRHQVPDLPRDRPTVPDCMPLVASIYRRHSAGCCLHIVLDDFNTDADSARWCHERATHDDCRELASMLMRMTNTQRRRVASKVWQADVHRGEFKNG